MTTITIVEKNGYAAIAADSLCKSGAAKSSASYIVNHHKIFRVGRSYLAIAGPTSAKLVLQNYFDSLKGEVSLSNVNDIFRTWLDLHQDLKDRYFLNTAEEDSSAFESSQVDVVIANTSGIFSVSSYRSVKQHSRFAAYGMGDQFAIGAMYAIYDDASKNAEAIARVGLEAACEFDDSTGSPIFSYMIQLQP